MLINLTDDWKEISSTLNYPLNIPEEDRKNITKKINVTSVNVDLIL